jgi:hypothetical protein
MSQNNSFVMSYLDLRKAIGIIGITLPFVLAIGKIILTGQGIESSISAYYYTVMRDVFVASLCAIGVFLLSYRGYAKIDAYAGKLATIFAIGTAFLPTIPPVNATAQQIIIGRFHLGLAICLFLTLSFFALFLFRKTNPNGSMTENKKMRNIIYSICGYGMLASIGAIIMVQLLPRELALFNYDPVFWLEALAIVLFGISWFVKGEAILKDAESQTF